MPAQSESDTPDERAGEIGGVGDGCAGRTDFEFSLACECEAVPGANDGTRGDDNRGQAEGASVTTTLGVSSQVSAIDPAAATFPRARARRKHS